jgi:hypothetical protein
MMHLRAYPTLDALLAHWNGLRGSRPFPRRSEFDPASVPRLLPHIFIMERKPGSETFHYRLIGTFIEARVGRNLAGLTLAQFRDGAAHDHIHAVFATCLDERVPVFGQSRLQGESSDIMQFYRLALPMSSDGELPDQILGAWDCSYRDRKTSDWTGLAALNRLHEIPVSVDVVRG